MSAQTMAEQHRASAAPGPRRTRRDDDVLKIARDLASRQLFAALMCAGPRGSDQGWGPAEAGGRFHGGEGQIGILLKSVEAETDVREFEEIDALTLDVLLVVFDRVIQAPDGVLVTPRLVLEAKGYRRWGRERIAFERKILTHLRMLARFEVEAGAFFAFQPRNVARTDFIVRPGPALAGALAKGAVAELPASVLQIDHRRNRGADPLAKKLAIHFALAGPMQGASVRDLLAGIGELAGTNGASRQGRLALRFEEAASRLAAMRLFDVRQDAAFARRKGWIQPWLYSAIDVEPCFGRRQAPAASAALLQKQEPTQAVCERDFANWMTHPEARGRGRPPFVPTPEHKRRVRSMFASGHTREDIAEDIGISLPTLRRYFADELGLVRCGGSRSFAPGEADVELSAANEG